MTFSLIASVTTAVTFEINWLKKPQHIYTGGTDYKIRHFPPMWSKGISTTHCLFHHDKGSMSLQNFVLKYHYYFYNWFTWIVNLSSLEIMGVLFPYLWTAKISRWSPNGLLELHCNSSSTIMDQCETTKILLIITDQLLSSWKSIGRGSCCHNYRLFRSQFFSMLKILQQTLLQNFKTDTK
jgi:hypothetical protein